MATNGRIVTVFGGAGFLGRRIVRHLRDREFQVRSIQIGGIVSLAVMIRNFDSSTPIFTTNGLSRMRLPALTPL